MGKLSLELLKERIADRYDPEYLVDVLGITTEEILDAFEEKLLAKAKNSEFWEVENDDDDED